MSVWKTLTEKTVHTVKEEGILKVGTKACGYIKKQIRQKKTSSEAGHVYKDILFIDGCGAVLPHPARYRVSHQREQLLAYGITSDEVYFQDIDVKQIRQYGVFLFFRCPMTEQIREFVKKAREYGKTILYDIDDLVFDTKYTDTIPFVQAMSKEDRAAYDRNVQKMGELLDCCQGAVTTTECLAEALQAHVPSVCINRNRASEEMAAISKKALEAKKERKEDGKVRLGYFSGSITHNADMEMLLPVLEYVFDKYDNLELFTVGELELPKELKKYEGRIRSLPFGDWRKLPEYISMTDINLAPLTDSIFNQAKSENKWVEASLVEVVTAASDLGAFAHAIKDKETGFLCKTEEDWKETLSLLIEHKEIRENTARAARIQCQKEYLTLYTGKTLADFIKTQRKKNMAFLLPALNISGGILVAFWHGKILREAGYDVTFIADNCEEESCSFQGEEFPVLSMKDLEVPGHFDGMTATMWVTVAFMENCKNVRQKYYLVQNYETDFYEMGSMYRAAANATYSHEDIRYITISRWCQKWLLEEFGQKASYAPNGILLESFEGERPKRNGKIRILIEGDCGAEHKNVDESFRIVEKLPKDAYEIWYMSYNSCPKDWYHVDRFLHKVPFEQVAEVYRQCDLLLKTSILESFSYPPLEMMASGGIAVVRLNDGNKEYLVPGENCLSYEPGNEEEAVSCIRRIEKDETLRKKLWAGGKETARSRNWKEVTPKILTLYQ